MADKSLARLVDLVPYISTHQGIEIKELASVFNVSIKQIEADLMTLFMCGYPFYQPMEVHFEDGVVTISNANELSMVRKLTKLELLALIVGLNSLRIDDSDKDKLMIKLSAKLVSSEDPKYDSAFDEYFGAIAQNEILEISYLSIDRDQVSEREIVPLDIYQRNGHTYLKSFCLLSNAKRTFRLDRILKYKRSGRSDLSHIPDEVANQSGSATIKIYHSQRYVTEYFGGIGFGEEMVGSVKYFNSDWMVRSVLAFAGAVSVKDDEIRGEVARRGRQARALYD